MAVHKSLGADEHLSGGLSPVLFLISLCTITILADLAVHPSLLLLSIGTGQIFSVAGDYVIDLDTIDVEPVRTPGQMLSHIAVVVNLVVKAVNTAGVSLKCQLGFLMLAKVRAFSSPALG